MDASALLRVRVCQPRSPYEEPPKVWPGSRLVPHTQNATWWISPLGPAEDWRKVESVTDREYIEANNPEIVMLLLEGEREFLSDVEASGLIRALQSEPRNACLAAALYDLDGPCPNFFVRPADLDMLLDQWQIERDPKLKVRSKAKGWPSFSDLVQAAE